MARLTALADALHVEVPIGAGAADLAGGPANALFHAVADLRRGRPCLLGGAGLALGLVAAETASEAALATLLDAGAPAHPVLLLAPGRAAALRDLPPGVGPVVALSVGPSALAPARLRALADPTAPQAGPGDPALDLALAPIPPGAASCLALAKRARLLPAVLVVPLASESAMPGAVVVRAEDVPPMRTEAELSRVAEAMVPLADAADSRVVAFRDAADGMEHLAILVGRPEAATSPLVRIHSECFTGDLLGSLRCDCGPQLSGALRRMAEEGAGVVLYLAQEGRGIGLVNKLRAYALQDRGMDTLDANEALGWGADERDFGIAATMLRLLGLRRVRLLTNNPRKLSALAQAGIAAERVSHLFASNGVNDAYLATKVARFGHFED